MPRFKYTILFVIAILLSNAGFSKTKEEEKLLKDADGHFKKESFLVAEKIYRQLLFIDKTNVEYNYKYGACLLNTAPDKTKALTHLSFAVKNSSAVNEAHFYYAKALQYNYQFKKALANYTKYRTVITQAKADRMEVDASINQCKTSIKLIEKFSPVKVVSSKVMNKKTFEKAYRLSGMGRKVLVKPNLFTTKEDFLVKKGDAQLIVHGTEQKTLFFSGYKYGNRFGILEQDIYMVKKSEDGIWSNFLDIGPFINTDFDEAYPYLHPNGQELYFSSKGHGGMGGYDIFKSQLDSVTGLWGRPVNLGFAVNSAFDDILYVVDQNDEIAYFSSNRANESSQITVYKIISSNKIENFILYKGVVTVEDEKSNAVEIEVFDAEGSLVSKYKSDIKTGEFMFPLAELESFRLVFTFKKKTSQSIKLVTPLKSSQNVIYHNITFKVGERPTLETEHVRDYVLSDTAKFVAFQELSKIDVNQNSDFKFGEKIIPAKKGIEDITITDPDILLKDAQAALGNLKQEKKDLSNQINAGYIVTHNNTVSSFNNNNDLRQLASSVKTKTDSGRVEIKNKQEEYNRSIKNIVDVMSFIENQENLILQKDDEIALIDAYLKQINIARGDDKIDLTDYRKRLIAKQKELSKQNEDKTLAASRGVKDLKTKRSEIQNKQYNLKSEKALIQDAIEFITALMTKTKKEEERANYAIQITELEKAKKKKSPIYAENKLLLVELDSLLKIQEQELRLYGEVGSESSQSSMKRVILKERETIAHNARLAVNKSKYAGKLDNFVVKNVIIGSGLKAQGYTAKFSSETFEPTSEDFTAFLGANLNDASDDQINHFSNKIFGVENVSDGKYNNQQISQKDQLAANNFREALMMRQEIEKKKKQLTEATDEAQKEKLREEIQILEDHLFKMESEAMEVLVSSNDLRQKEKNAALETSFLLNQGIQTGEVAQLYEQANGEWDEITMLKQRLANNSSREQKSNISKEILNKQMKVIAKLVKIERLINGESTDVQQTGIDLNGLQTNTDPNTPSDTDPTAPDSPINFNPDPTNRPLNNYGRGGGNTNTNTTYKGVNIAQYGSNSTMRVKKGILITSDIKYTINTKVPVDIELGTGIIYKVQVGAFRNKINPEIFNGITPLSAENSGNGVYRYTAGIFKSLTGANMAKGKIVDIGYSDAFVVAFYNGKRISLSKATSVINGSSESQLAVFKDQKSSEIKALKKAGITEKDANISRSSSPNPINKYNSLNVPNSGTSNDNFISGNNTNNNANSNKSATSDGLSRSTNAEGVYYTVQIGVYSSNKTSSDLFGISPLVTHTDDQGLIRYSTGVFKTLEEASKRKKEARAQGAEDAYVAVYRDGVRISLEDVNK